MDSLLCLKSQTIIKSFGSEGSLEVFSLTACSEQVQQWDLLGLFMLLSRSLLKTSKGKDYITSLSNLCPTVFLGKTIFFIPSLNFSCFNLGLLSLILLPCTSAQMLALSSQCPPAGLGWLMLPEPVSSPGCATPCPSASPCRTRTPASRRSSTEPAPVRQHFSCIGRGRGDVQNWTQYSRCGLPSAKPNGMITFLVAV